MKLYELSIVSEANDENNNPTCWAMKVGESKGYDMFIWICKYDNYYQIEDSNGYKLISNIYKTLKGAMKKAIEIGKRQNEYGTFTN